MDPLHPSSTPYPSHVQSTLRLNPSPSLSAIPHPAPTPTTSRRIQCNPSNNFVLLYPVYVCYIIILFVTDEATIKAKRVICFLKESRVTLSFVVKSKLVTVLSLFHCKMMLELANYTFLCIARVEILRDLLQMLLEKKNPGSIVAFKYIGLILFPVLNLSKCSVYIVLLKNSPAILYL